MPTSWEEIHTLEMREALTEAINALENRLQVDPTEIETVIRLGFDYWYILAEEFCMGIFIPYDQYASRFMQLLRQYEPALINNADFHMSFGLGLFLFPFYFPGGTESEGKRLIDRAKQLDDFWKSQQSGTVTEDARHKRFRGRGILQYYFCPELSS